jgi:hypothetical protein
MFCHAHADQAAAAKCTGCGVLLCAACRRRDAGRALCPSCFEANQRLAIRVYPVAPQAPVAQPVAPPPAQPTMPVVIRPPRRPRPGLAGALGIVPGLGHIYAGSWGKGLLLLGVVFPVAALAVAGGGLPAAAYAFGHGLVAFDGYRLARKARGEWSREDSREAKGVWLACAAVLLLLAGARASGAPLSLWVSWPALMVPLGVGLALGERTNRVDARAEQAKPAELPPPPPVEKPLQPGETVDRRMKRGAASQLLNV